MDELCLNCTEVISLYKIIPIIAPISRGKI